MTETKVNPYINAQPGAPPQSFEYLDMTLLPVRCFTCSKILGDKWERYQRLLSQGRTIEQALNEMKITHTCCRINIMNPPKIPLALQVNNTDAEITELYRKFHIDEKTSRALTTNTPNMEIINTTNDPAYNPKPLNATNRPKRIYELTSFKRKQQIYQIQRSDPVVNSIEAFKNIETDLE